MTNKRKRCVDVLYFHRVTKCLPFSFSPEIRENLQNIKCIPHFETLGSLIYFIFHFEFQTSYSKIHDIPSISEIKFPIKFPNCITYTLARNIACYYDFEILLNHYIYEK